MSDDYTTDNYVDWGDQVNEEGRPATLPAGWYTAMVDTAELRRAVNAPFRDYFALTLLLMDSAYEGKRVRNSIALPSPRTDPGGNPGLLNMTFSKLKAILGDDLRKEERFKYDDPAWPELMMGRIVRIRVQPRAGTNGMMYDDVRAIQPLARTDHPGVGGGGAEETPHAAEPGGRTTVARKRARDEGSLPF